METGVSDSHSWCVWSAFFILGIFSLFIHFIWLFWVLVVAQGIFSFRMWDLIPHPGMETGPPALGVQTFSFWTTRKSQVLALFQKFYMYYLILSPNHPTYQHHLKDGEIETRGDWVVCWRSGSIQGPEPGWGPRRWPHCLKWSELKSLSRVQLFATPWTVAYQAPASMGFSRQEYWSGLPFGLLVNKAVLVWGIEGGRGL